MFTVTMILLLPFYFITSKPAFVIVEPDISLLASISLLPFSAFKRTKLVMDVRSTPVDIVGVRGYFQKLCFDVSVHIAKRFFNGITTITSFMKEEISKEFSINPDLIGVWSSGVSTKVFDPRHNVSNSLELKESLGLSGKFVVLYHGALSPNRGLQETIEAVNRLKVDYPNIVFLLLGRGSAVYELENLVRLKGLRENVVIHGSVDYAEVPAYIAMSDVGIVPLPDHPYWNFQSPLKLLEYLAMEKVVILTDIPAHRSVIRESECGIYISSAKAVEIAKSILYAYNNRGQLENWGKLGRKIIEERFTWDKIAEMLEGYLVVSN